MKKFSRYLTRALEVHVRNHHRMRVQLFPDGTGHLEIYCLWCGSTVCAGSPSLINDLAQMLVESDCKITKLNNPTISLRVH